MKNHVAEKHLKVYFAILLGMVIPFALTLLRVHEPMATPPLTPTLSPLGYSYSLLIFVVPIIFFIIWLIKNPQYKIETKAYWGCIAGVFILGCILDFIFGYSFFTFPNREAVWGLRLTSFSFETWSWVSGYLPIEEFGFYLLGAMYMISMYLWGVLFWFRRYNHSDHGSKCFELDKIFDPNKWVIVFCLALVIVGFIVKKMGPHPEGFSGYFTFIIV